MAAFQSPLENLEVHQKEEKEQIKSVHFAAFYFSRLPLRIHHKNHLQITDSAVYVDFFKDVFKLYN